MRRRETSPSEFERQYRELFEQRRGKMPGQEQVPDYHEGPPFPLNAMVGVFRLGWIGIASAVRWLRRVLGGERWVS